MTEQSGARVLVDCLLAQGVTAAFGVPGESYLAVLDALHDVSERIRLIPNRHEGGAAFMAEAWGKLTGAPGIAFVTRGPGATNAAIGVHTAMQNSSPMILFVGQIETEMRGREAFQEVDYRAVFGPLAKWAVEIDHADRVSEILARAFATALTGRPGPVIVALPEDVLAAGTDRSAGPRVRIPRAAPEPGAIAEIARMLAEARAPLILAGGGGWDDAAQADLKRFAEGNHLPVLTAFRRQNAIDNHSPAYAGDAGLGKAASVRALIEGADLILGIGLRFDEPTTDGYALFGPPPFLGPRLIHVHASAAELNKIYTADLAIHAHPALLLAALRDLRVEAPWQARTARARADYEAGLAAPPQPGALDMGEVLRWLQAELPDDAILTNGAGNFAIWPNKHFAYGPRQRLLAPQSGAMGYGLPAAIAAKVARPLACVVCFAGDGDFQMTLPELGCAMQAGAQPIVLVIDNGSYGTIRMHQERTYPDRVSFTDIANPDFTAIARAYGFHAEKITRTQDFAPAFERARASPTGAVLHLVADIEALTPRQTLSAMRDAAQRTSPCPTTAAS